MMKKIWVFFLCLTFSPSVFATEEGDLYAHVDAGNFYGQKKLDNFVSLKAGYCPYAFWGYGFFTDATWNQVRGGPEIRFSYEPFEAFAGLSSLLYRKGAEHISLLESFLIQFGMTALAPLTSQTAAKAEIKMEPNWQTGYTSVFFSLGFRFTF